jgi:hypothetical protein
MNLMKSKTAAWSQGPEREEFSRLGAEALAFVSDIRLSIGIPEVVELAGIEPAASALQRRRSPS